MGEKTKHNIFYKPDFGASGVIEKNKFDEGLDAADSLFDKTTGHKHSGSEGDGAKVDHSQLLNTHNLTTDINHNQILNSHNLTTDINHNQLTNFIANKHIDHSLVSISAGGILSGGGDITQNRTISLELSNIDHSLISNLDFAKSGHTGFQPEGNYLTEETDPVFSAWDKSTGISITESQISDFGKYEPTLGNPAVDGYVLSSTIAGVRSWVVQSEGVTDHAALTHLDYASAGHTGFQATLGYTPVNKAGDTMTGGLSINNATNPQLTIVTPAYSDGPEIKLLHTGGGYGFPKLTYYSNSILSWTVGYDRNLNSFLFKDSLDRIRFRIYNVGSIDAKLSDEVGAYSFNVLNLDDKSVFKVKSSGAMEIKFRDNAGAYKFSLFDSDEAEVASIDSDGNIIATNLNISDWDTAFGWGDHAGLYSLLGHDHDGVYEPVLGNPADDGYVLSSTMAGVRSWVAQGGGVSAHSELTELDYASAGHTGFQPAGDYQPLDATLTSIAALGTAADKGLYTTDVDTWAEFSLTAAGRALLDDANAAAQIATLGLDADIATLSLPASTTITAAAQTILDDANVGAIRTTLGVGTGDSPVVVSILPTTAVGAAASYVPNSYLTRVYLNSTAYWNGASAGVLAGTGAMTLTLDIGMTATKRIYLDGVARTGDTYICESSANVIDIALGGNILRISRPSAGVIQTAVV